MVIRILILGGCILVGNAGSCLAQPRAVPRGEYPPQLEGAKVELYKTIGDVKLRMYIFNPEGHQPSDQRAAAVFFFGGGWKSGTPKQFEQQCRHLASRGMVAMTADYRVLSRHGTPAVECVKDAKSAIRWVRREAARLGVDPERILAGGGSAGGHLAACTGTVEGFDEPSEEAAISSRPNAMALFNPALVLVPVDGRPPLSEDSMRGLRERLGVEPRKLSPFHQLRAGVPSTIIFHGTGDETVPYHTAQSFAAAMQEAGNRCELIGYEDQPHGFFNYGRNQNQYYRETLQALDKFLVSIGYLPASQAQ